MKYIVFQYHKANKIMKMAVFVLTAVRTSNPTKQNYVLLQSFECSYMHNLCSSYSSYIFMFPFVSVFLGLRRLGYLASSNSELILKL
jgi:hypothetical protein